MDSFSEIPDWVKEEHEVAKLLQEQETYGWYFDERSAWELASTLRTELEETHRVLLNRHPFVAGSLFTPKRNNRTKGYVEGAPFTKIKDFNPSSRDQIAWILQTFHGWKPTTLTTTGKPVIDEKTMEDAVSDGIQIAKTFHKLLDITKKLGMISEGAKGWLKLSTTAKRIHHSCHTGAVTFRCSHQNPNLAQVPSEERFRRLFTASPGMVMVGADLCGIELRMLSHFLSRYDGGRYRDILLNGDIHQVNADKIGISRSAVKTVTYAFLYGAGDSKLGRSYDQFLSEEDASKKGKELKEAFVEAIPGLDKLLSSLKEASKKGYLKAIDGRKIKVDSQHKALNFLLQGNAAILAKRWMLINQRNIKELELNCYQLAFVHDELQFDCDPTHARDLCTSLVCASLRAGEEYNLRIPIDAEYSIGNNWAETH